MAIVGCTSRHAANVGMVGEIKRACVTAKLHTRANIREISRYQENFRQFNNGDRNSHRRVISACCAILDPAECAVNYVEIAIMRA